MDGLHDREDSNVDLQGSGDVISDDEDDFSGDYIYQEQIAVKGIIEAPSLHGEETREHFGEEDSPVFVVTPRPGKLELTIRNASRKHAGRYECRATNSVGTSTPSPLELSVAGKNYDFLLNGEVYCFHSHL